MPEKLLRTRPWTLLPGGEYYSSNRKKNKVQIPKINTYNNQFEKCQRMYARLKLEESSDGRPILPRLHTSVEFSSSGDIHHHFSTKSAPATAHPDRDVVHPIRAWQPHIEKQNSRIDDIDNKSLDSANVSEKITKRHFMDPIRLSKHLRDHGFGLPLIVPTSTEEDFPSNYRRRPLKSRSLPKNPSKREKIKGRARLDYEMANLRALAFCAQQSPKKFRSASANMKNRDVQFVDEEVRDRMHRDIDDGDDTASIVVMPIDKEELCRRIDNWMDEVDKAVKEVT